MAPFNQVTVSKAYLDALEEQAARAKDVIRHLYFAKLPGLAVPLQQGQDEIEALTEADPDAAWAARVDAGYQRAVERRADPT